MTESTTAQKIDEVTALAAWATRARIRLEEAPDIVEHVRFRRRPGGAVQDGMPRSSRSEPPAPLNVGALDEADQIYAELINWVRYWAERLQIRALPTTIDVAWHGQREALGFRPTATPPGAAALTRNLCTWLLLQGDKIHRHPYAGNYYTEVTRLIEHGYSKFPLSARPPRAHSPRACPVCGEFTVTADWVTSNGDPSEDINDLTVWCEHCKHVIVSTTRDGRVTQREYRSILNRL